MMGVSVNILATIVLLGILIFAHEFGHFIVAKRLGVGVLKFSLGFGRRLFGKKIGETEYLVSMIPLGGYVKLLGESDQEVLSPEDQKRSFLTQPVWKRIAIVLAGPVFNFLLAIIIFAVIFMAGIPVYTSVIGEVQKDSAAFKAGLKAGDAVVAIDGKNVSRWDDMSVIISESQGKTLTLTVTRDGQNQELKVTPTKVQDKDIFGEEIDLYRIGIMRSSQTVIERQNPLEACWSSLKQTWFFVKVTLISFVKLVEGVISPSKSLGGPIFIAQLAGAAVKKGLLDFVYFMAVLSVNLAILNLLPIPVLDGGHLMFYGIEMIIGRPVSLKWREMAQQIGFVLLILLMIFVFMLDIDRLNIKAVNEFTKFFTGK
jgi:regulator of sigma E protease